MAGESAYLAGKVALVTGGSSGIGRSACLAFARRGCRVAVHYRSGRDRAAAVVERIRAEGGDAAAFGADVASLAEVRCLVDAVAARWGRLDVLVNNAGDPIRRLAFAEVDEDTLDRALAVNLKGPFLLTQAALPLLRQVQGAVVNVSSSMSLKGSGGDNSHYMSAKGGLNALTLALAAELSPLGIRVNCVCPAVTATELQDRLSTPERVRRAAGRSLLRRVAHPDEIAETIVFLASEAASYINAQLLVADGGRA